MSTPKVAFSEFVAAFVLIYGENNRDRYCVWEPNTVHPDAARLDVPVGDTRVFDLCNSFGIEPTLNRVFDPAYASYFVPKERFNLKR